MSEADVIQNTPQPATVETLKADFQSLGVEPGMTLILHSSLRSLGWVSGGPVAVILALEEILTPQGTLVMPAHSGDLSDPAEWSNPPVPEDWKELIRRTMPAFDPDLTPTRGLGVIPETFRKQRGVLRSGHPQNSFTAWGAKAQEITARHPLHFAFGENSPLARIYDLGGWILLLGVEHDSNTSLHLAEYRAAFKGKKEIKQGAPLLVEGQRRWVEFRDYTEHSGRFPAIGSAYRAAGGLAREGKIGQAQALLIPQRDLVDFAVGLMETSWPE